MDILGFKDFKTFYGDVLAKRAREGAGVLSKADFLVAIEEPFQLAFTPERIKKSFALVGPHPYNPDAITPAMMAPSKATSLHTPLHINESSPIKRIKFAISDALEHDVPAIPLLPLLSTADTPVATEPTPESEIGHHLDTNAVASGSSGSASNARGLLSDTHLHWLTSDNPITSSDRIEIFDTPPDSYLNPPPIPDDPANPAAEPDLTMLLPQQLIDHIKSLYRHSHDLSDILKAQRIQIGLDGMVINRLQKQLYNKEQRAKKQRSLTTMATTVTEPAFVEMVKEIEQAAKERRQKREATQITRTRKKALRDLRTP